MASRFGLPEPAAAEEGEVTPPRLRTLGLAPGAMPSRSSIPRGRAGPGEQFTEAVRFGAGGVGASTLRMVGAAGTAVGAPESFSEGLEERAQAIEEGVEESRPRVQRLEDIRFGSTEETVEDVQDYLIGLFGTQVPMLGSIVAGGGVGGLALRGAGRTALGATAGAALTGGVLEGGDVVAGMREDEPGPLTRRQAVIALGAGAASGALNVIPLVRLAGNLGLGAPARNAVQRRLLERMTREGAVGAGLEGITEIGQALIHRAARDFASENFDILGPGLASDVINQAVAGVIIGGTLGAATGALQRSQRAPAEEELSLEALEAEEAQRTAYRDALVERLRGRVDESVLDEMRADPFVDEELLGRLEGLVPADVREQMDLEYSRDFAEANPDAILEDILDKVQAGQPLTRRQASAGATAMVTMGRVNPQALYDTLTARATRPGGNEMTTFGQLLEEHGAFAEGMDLGSLLGALEEQGASSTVAAMDALEAELGDSSLEYFGAYTRQPRLDDLVTDTEGFRFFPQNRLEAIRRNYEATRPDTTLEVFPARVIVDRELVQRGRLPGSDGYNRLAFATAQKFAEEMGLDPQAIDPADPLGAFDGHFAAQPVQAPSAVTAADALSLVEEDLRPGMRSEHKRQQRAELKKARTEDEKKAVREKFRGLRDRRNILRRTTREGTLTTPAQLPITEVLKDGRRRNAAIFLPNLVRRMVRGKRRMTGQQFNRPISTNEAIDGFMDGLSALATMRHGITDAQAATQWDSLSLDQRAELVDVDPIPLSRFAELPATLQDQIKAALAPARFDLTGAADPAGMSETFATPLEAVDSFVRTEREIRTTTAEIRRLQAQERQTQDQVALEELQAQTAEMVARLEHLQARHADLVETLSTTVVMQRKTRVGPKASANNPITLLEAIATGKDRLDKRQLAAELSIQRAEQKLAELQAELAQTRGRVERREIGRSIFLTEKAIENLRTLLPTLEVLRARTDRLGEQIHPGEAMYPDQRRAIQNRIDAIRAHMEEQLAGATGAQRRNALQRRLNALGNLERLVADSPQLDPDRGRQVNEIIESEIESTVFTAEEAAARRDLELAEDQVGAEPTPVTESDLLADDQFDVGSEVVEDSFLDFLEDVELRVAQGEFNVEGEAFSPTAASALRRAIELDPVVRARRALPGSREGAELFQQQQAEQQLGTEVAQAVLAALNREGAIRSQAELQGMTDILNGRTPVEQVIAQVGEASTFAADATRVAEWSRRLNLKTPAQLLSTEQVLRNLAAQGDVGRIARIHEGTLRGISFGDGSIWVHPNLRGQARLETMGHEMGHVIAQQFMPQNFDSVHKAWMRWRKEHGKPETILADIAASKQALETAARNFGRHNADTLAALNKEQREYVLDFEEWFADNVARAMANPQSQVQGWIKRFVEAIKRLFGLVQDQGYKADATVEQFITRLMHRDATVQAGVREAMDLLNIPNEQWWDFALTKDHRLRVLQALGHDKSNNVAWDRLSPEIRNELDGLRQRMRAQRSAPQVTTVESGGAAGADTAWGDAAVRLGMVARHHSFPGHSIRGRGERVQHSPQELKQADAMLSKVNREQLKRSFPPSSGFVTNLLRRNFFQVRDSEAVLAVGQVAHAGTVEGGTGWAVALGVEMGKPVYVFDQNKGAWFRRDETQWTRVDSPPPFTRFAGIGTRALRPNGRQAIEQYLQGLNNVREAMDFGRPEGKDFTLAELMRRNPFSQNTYHAISEKLHELLRPEERTALGRAFAVDGAMRRQIAAKVREHGPGFAHHVMRSPTEAITAGYVLWTQGHITVGPKTRGIFGRTLDAISRSLGNVSDADQAAQVLEALGSGQLQARKDQGSEWVLMRVHRATALQRIAQSTKDAYDKHAKTLFDKIAMPAFQALDRTGNPALIELSRMFHARAGESVTREGYLAAKNRHRDAFLNQLFRAFDKNPSIELINEVHTAFREGRRATTPEARRAQIGVRRLLDEMFDYMVQAGVLKQSDFRPDYFPQVWDVLKVQEAKEEWIARALSPEFSKGWEGIAKQYRATWEKEIMGPVISEFDEARQKAIKRAVETGKFPDSMRALFAHNKHWLRAFELFRKHGEFTVEGVVEITYQALVGEDGYSDLNLDVTAGARNPFVAAMNHRALGFLVEGATENHQFFQGMLQENLDAVMRTYINQATKRAEFEKSGGIRRVQRLLTSATNDFGATTDQMQMALDLVDAMQGTLGHETGQWLAKWVPGFEKLEPGQVIDPRFQRLQSVVLLWQNVRTLALAAFTSLSDYTGILVRGGGFDAVRPAFEAMREGSYARQVSEGLGLTSTYAINEALGGIYSANFMTGRTKAWNDRFFKVIGLEMVTRTSRLMATGTGLAFLKRHVQRPTKDSKRYLEELGIEASDVKFNADSNVQFLTRSERSLMWNRLLEAYAEASEAAQTRDLELEQRLDAEINELSDAISRDDRVRGALNLFVDQTIMRPTAATRPGWASDPHFALVFHLKTFIYNFHSQILTRVWAESLRGNQTPFMLLFAYIPVMIVADVFRDIAAHGPGGDPMKKNWDMMDWTYHGARRAGLPGLGSFILDAHHDRVFGGIGIESALGPTASSIDTLFSGLARGDASDALMQQLPFQNTFAVRGTVR